MESEAVLDTDQIGSARGGHQQQQRVALAHDYFTQRGGAERVALEMSRAFPGAPLYTSVYSPQRSFPELLDVPVLTTRLNHVAAFRADPRLALPLLPYAVSGMKIDACVVLASSSGWAHGVQTTGRKIVYCHAPARWLYQTQRYLGSSERNDGSRSLSTRLAGLYLRSFGDRLRRWDSSAALMADRYIVNSSVTKAAVLETYGIDAEILHPPPALLPDGNSRPLPGLEPGFFLAVSRLLPYKNLDVSIRAAARFPDRIFVIVGSGPYGSTLDRLARELPNVRLVGSVDDDQLRWLYSNAAALIATSYEDFGLTPLEAAGFGCPVVALRAGGYLDTVREGLSGIFVDELCPDAVASALRDTLTQDWRPSEMVEYAGRFGVKRFHGQLRKYVQEELNVQ